MIRGGIFDLDGVLLDSMGIWKDLGARYLCGRNIRPEPGLNEILFSMSMEQGAAYLKKQYQLAETEAEILQQITGMLERFYCDEVQAKPGAETLLRILSDRGIPMAAATSTPRKHVTCALDRLGFLPHLRAIFTTSEVGQSKHTPLIYQKTAAFLGTAPAQTLVFEDSFYALKTAAMAGFRTVGIYDSNGESDQASLRATAEFYLTDLNSFPDVWKRLESEDETAVIL